MLSVYPFGSGSLYNAAYAITASHAVSASFIKYVVSASNAATVLYPQSGSRGKSVCLLTKEQYEEMIALNKMEICNFSS
jgi:hypothetical protein